LDGEFVGEVAGVVVVAGRLISCKTYYGEREGDKKKERGVNIMVEKLRKQHNNSIKSIGRLTAPCFFLFAARVSPVLSLTQTRTLSL
jgi:hypothetical protein